MNPTQITELKAEIFEDVFKPVIPCLVISLTDNKQLTFNNSILTTNKLQQNINICDILTQKLKSEK
ncbi:hypothetical protein C6497_14060 [Candidatus Poribacteria bacterium]|nr:MAG: hypothetical protein C6497_14060 [Candidatus Poribacteria bacterium]